MANFRTHVTTSTVFGCGYAATACLSGFAPLNSSLIAGGLCGVAGMLPDLDSDNGIPLREVLGFAAAVVPMFLVDRFAYMKIEYETMVLISGAIYLFVRFGVAKLIAKNSVHRGMFHSIPAALIFAGIAFLVCGSQDLHIRYLKAGGVLLGVLSHLLLDEMYSVEWKNGRWRLKKSFGTAFKLWGNNAWANLSTYAKLAVVAAMIAGEPMVMQRFESSDSQLGRVVNEYNNLRTRYFGTDENTHGQPVNQPPFYTNQQNQNLRAPVVQTQPNGNAPQYQPPVNQPRVGPYPQQQVVGNNQPPYPAAGAYQQQPNYAYPPPQQPVQPNYNTARRFNDGRPQ